MPRKYVRKKGSNTPGRPRIPVKPISVGLPPKEIVLDQVIYWIGLQATAEDIASSFYVDVDTLNAKIKEHLGLSFSELKEKCHGSGKLSLRRYQFKQAERNCSMAIWLGKQWLGQKDHDEKAESVVPNEKLIALEKALTEAQATILLQAEELKKRDESKPKTDPIDHPSDSPI